MSDYATTQHKCLGMCYARHIQSFAHLLYYRLQYSTPWRDMEKLQVYLCQSNTRLAIFLHFVQVSKMSFVLSVLFFPSRGVVSIRPQFLMILKNKLVSGSKNSFAFSKSGWGEYWPVFLIILNLFRSQIKQVLLFPRLGVSIGLYFLLILKIVQILG